MRVVLSYLMLIGGLAVLVLLSLAYEWSKRRLCKPVIGLYGVLMNYIKREDYVCIKSRVLRFSHIARGGESISLEKPPIEGNKTLGGELAFFNPRGLDYVYFCPTALDDCQFIYGKYGLKWAANSELADKAQRMIEESGI